MKILIIGAGRIGVAVAESLVSEANDITVVDLDGKNIEWLMSRYDLRGLVGDAVSPSLLKEAGAADADMLLAVTSSDETNLAVCLLADRIFNIPTRLARVRNFELRSYPRLLKEEGFGATSIIWPEQALTNYIVRLIDIPEALQVKDFGNGAATLVAVRAEAGSPMVGGRIDELVAHVPHACARIVALFRDGRNLPLSRRTIIETGDEALILSEADHSRLATTQLCRRSGRVKSLIIAGSAKMAKGIVDALLEDSPYSDRRVPDSIRVIEDQPAVAEKLAVELGDKAAVLAGDFDDEDVLVTAGVQDCDLFVALSGDDENNILSAMLAKRLGAKRTIALINRRIYGDLIEGSKIDVTVSQTQAALDELVRYVRRGDVTAAYTLRHGIAEALEIVAHGTKSNSKVVGRKLEDIRLPEDCRFAAIMRDRADSDMPQVVMPDPGVEVEPEDRILIFVPNRKLIPKIERLFAVDVGFF